MSEGIYSFKDLGVWQKSFQLAKDVYVFSNKLPVAERWGLVSQMQRCAVSIPSNIAEGQQRNNPKEFLQFIGISKGSAAELETQILLSSQIYQIEANDILSELVIIQKMLSSLSRSIRAKTNY